MKKTISLFISLVMLLASVGCAGTKANTPNEQGNENTPEPTAAQVPEENQTPAVAEVVGADVPDGVFVEVRPQCAPAYGVSFCLPSDWTYEVLQTEDDPTSTVTVDIMPKGVGLEGAISFYCSGGVFGVCGTGLEQRDVVFNGHEAWQGFYDGSSLWSFICLKDINGCAVINSAENWYEDYSEVIDQILATVEFVYYDDDAAPTKSFE